MPATASLRRGARIRVRRGNTVDTERIRGGDVKGCRGEVIHAPAQMAGPDGQKEERVLVALDDAPAGCGIVSLPLDAVETPGPMERARAFFGGITFGRGGRIVR